MSNSKIFDDIYFKECIKLAMNCKTDYRSSSAFGSVLVVDNEINGRGFNRAIVHKNFRLERIIRQGYVNHAEVEALNDTLMNERKAEGGRIYVAGYFPNSGQIFFHEEFSCLRCANCLKKYGVKEISVPMPEGWRTFHIDDAIVSAKKVPIKDRYQYRRETTIGQFFIGDI